MTSGSANLLDAHLPVVEGYGELHAFAGDASRPELHVRHGGGNKAVTEHQTQPEITQLAGDSSVVLSNVKSTVFEVLPEPLNACASQHSHKNIHTAASAVSMRLRTDKSVESGGNMGLLDDDIRPQEAASFRHVFERP
jgi:hypothetical protein